MKIRERGYSGTMDTEVRDYEIRHRELARIAASEGFVLLKNAHQLLPMQTGRKLALYGAGAVKTIKGGTGSGDVNERSVVSIYEGLEQAGFEITTKDWLNAYEAEYQKAREDWRDRIWAQCEGAGLVHFFNIYSTTTFHIPAGQLPTETETDTAIFVLSRIAGEGADRVSGKGDYCLSDEEEALLDRICELHQHVIVLINTGGVVDCSFVDAHENIEAVLLILQPGMEAGHAVADVLTGAVVPGGKLTDTWAYHYSDYPNYENYSHNNGDVEKEYYNEGIYVGYRYFDTKEIAVRYGFGYGLSYTTFSTELTDLKKDSRGRVTVSVKVTNTGTQYEGREVVQIYVSCPQTRLPKEYRRLTGFKKTGILDPGESEVLEITFGPEQLTSYDEAASVWILEAGCYGIYMGSSLPDSKLVGSAELDADVVVSQLKAICPLQEALTEFTMDAAAVSARRKAMTRMAAQLPKVELTAGEIPTEVIDYEAADRLEDSDVMSLVKSLSVEQLIQLATGDPGKGQGSNLGSSGISVPGSAAETSKCALDQGLASIVLADGPAGLRLNQTYHVDQGQIVPVPFEMSIEHGFLYRGDKNLPGEVHYQYCTAIPVGTLLAQSWDIELIETVGAAIGEEMDLFNVTLWLAPGMNIHRNPLCGRNFEYYSEDPLVAGRMAAAMTNGVQSVPGCGTTIKHFCCNNQEDNRMGSDSIVSERALREIYLKGFEIAVKTSQPMSIMTSYNLINGIHAANSYDLCTHAARKEWDFRGVIMTDWTTTENGPDCTAAGCMRAGNDLVMPGQPSDHENMRRELAEGKLTLKELQLCIAHMANIVLQSNQYEDAKRYLSI